VSIEYSDGEPDMITIPLSLATGEQAEIILRDKIHIILARLHGLPDPQSILYGAIFDRRFMDALLKAMLRRRRIKGEHGDLVGAHTRSFREAWGRVRSNLEPQPQTLDMHKIMVTLGEDFVLNLYREVEAGPNPDREMGEFLTNNTNFSHCVRYLGALEYRVMQDDETEAVTTLGTLTAYVRNAEDGWVYTLDHLGMYFERALAIAENDPRMKEITSGTPLALAHQTVPPIITELLGGYAETMVLLGRRTAELHVALSSQPEIPAFAPEPFTEFYRHGLYHGFLAQLNKSLDTLRQHMDQLSGSTLEEAREILDRRDTLRDRFIALRDTRISGMRARHHGDYHLGNVLYTGSDFLIANFDGDFSRPMSERRIKRSPIKDVASMVRSLHYVAHAVLFNHVPGIVTTPDVGWRLERWAKAWYEWVSALFLRGYLQAAAEGNCLPKTQPEIKALFDAYSIEKGLIEVEYELQNRPDWVRIPLHGILEQLQ
jgi:maltose alpha-D-glucosyltransferase/alpha-amylase